jgi:hypothetical protein
LRQAYDYWQDQPGNYRLLIVLSFQETKAQQQNAKTDKKTKKNFTFFLLHSLSYGVLNVSFFFPDQSDIRKRGLIH